MEFVVNYNYVTNVHRRLNALTRHSLKRYFRQTLHVLALMRCVNYMYLKNRLHFVAPFKYLAKVLLVCVGTATQLAPMYLMEISPFNLRGAFGTACQLFTTIGIFMSSIFGLREILGLNSTYLLI